MSNWNILLFSVIVDVDASASKLNNAQDWIDKSKMSFNYKTAKQAQFKIFLRKWERLKRRVITFSMLANNQLKD